MDFPNGSYEGKVNDIRILKESGLQRCLRQLFFLLKDADRFIYLVTKHISHDDLLWPLTWVFALDGARNSTQRCLACKLDVKTHLKLLRHCG